jgi:DNA repair exonuclease SbcCD ATPase subunit
MQLSAAHRREVIEDLLGIEVFTVMNSLLKDKVASNKTSIMQADMTLRSIADKIQIENQHLEVLQTNNDEQIKDKQSQIDVLEANIKRKEAQRKKVVQKLDAFDDLDSAQTDVINKQTNFVQQLRELNSWTSTHKKDIGFFHQHDDCPVCKQSIDQDFKQSAIKDKQTQIDEFEEQKQKYEAELEKLIASLDGIRTQIKIREQHRTQEKEMSADIVLWQRQIKSLQKDISSLNANVGHIEDNKQRLKDLKTHMKEQLTDREALGKYKSVLEVAAAMLKDSGIKTKIIRQYIPVINKLINKYLAAMDFFVNFQIDESFEEKIKSRFRDEFSYASFSEGEKSRLDLALLFTWRTIARLRNSTSTNLLILDEVFDGSLDGQGNEELLKILNTLTDGNNVFVISHKTDAYLDKFERVLKFQKVRNFSSMQQL